MDECEKCGSELHEYPYWCLFDEYMCVNCFKCIPEQDKKNIGLDWVLYESPSDRVHCWDCYPNECAKINNDE